MDLMCKYNLFWEIKSPAAGRIPRLDPEHISSKCKRTVWEIKANSRLPAIESLLEMTKTEYNRHNCLRPTVNFRLFNDDSNNRKPLHG